MEGNGTYVISPSDYGLSTIAMDGTQIGGVDVVVDGTNETLTRLTGTSAKQIPPGTYRFEFDNFASSEFIVEGNGTYVISPADYGLSTIAMDGTQNGGVDVVVAGTDETLTRLTGTSTKQIPPGTYLFEFDDYRSPEFIVEENQNYTISPSDYSLATVRLAERVNGQFLLLQGGQDPINIRDGREKQIGPGPYARVFDGVELGVIQIAPGETTIIEIE